MFFGIVSRWLERRSTGSPSRQETLNEAESQYLAKQAKLETALDGVFVNSLHKIDEDERETVAAYRAAKVPELSQVPSGREDKKKMGGDFIVCDDYRKGTGTIPAVVMGLVAVAALGLSAWAMTRDRPTDTPPDATQETPVDQNTQYEAGIAVE